MLTGKKSKRTCHLVAFVNETYVNHVELKYQRVNNIRNFEWDSTNNTKVLAEVRNSDSMIKMFVQDIFDSMPNNKVTHVITRINVVSFKVLDVRRLCNHHLE